METVEDLMINGYKIFQDDELYRFTSDAVLLSRFASVKKGDVVADFCSGSGIVGINLFALNEKVKSVTLFEMQKSLYDLSVKTVNYDGLGDKIFPVNVKIQDVGKEYEGKFSLIVCNPPYMEAGRGETDKKRHIAICRTEIELTLKELMFSVNRCLKFGGRFATVNRADRLVEVFSEMKKYNIEPKRLQFVSGKGKEPYLFLTEGVKGGKTGLKVLSTLEN